MAEASGERGGGGVGEEIGSGEDRRTGVAAVDWGLGFTPTPKPREIGRAHV